MCANWSEDMHSSIEQVPGMKAQDPAQLRQFVAKCLTTRQRWLVCLGTSSVFEDRVQGTGDCIRHNDKDSITVLSGSGKILRLPPPYPSAELIDQSNNTCGSQYDTEYIRNFIQSEISYCDNTSTASLTCFSSESPNSHVDTFCVGSPARTSVSEGSVSFSFKPRDMSAEDLAEYSPLDLDTLTSYWTTLDRRSSSRVYPLRIRTR